MKSVVSTARKWVVMVFVIFSVAHFVHLDVVFPQESPSPAREVRRRQGTNLRSGSNQGGLKIEFPNTGTQTIFCSANDTFCEDMPNYPGNEVERVVSNNATALEFLRFNADSEDSLFQRKVPQETDRNEKPICEAVTRVVFPKAAKTSDDVWKYVVNTGTTYKQGVVIEQCSQDNAPCNRCRASKSRCVQKYIKRKLLAFDETNKDSYIDLFNFPGSCVCYVTDLF